VLRLAGAKLRTSRSVTQTSGSAVNIQEDLDHDVSGARSAFEELTRFSNLFDFTVTIADELRVEASSDSVASILSNSDRLNGRDRRGTAGSMTAQEPAGVSSVGRRMRIPPVIAVAGSGCFREETGRFLLSA
jgi:hypothetical protein